MRDRRDAKLEAEEIRRRAEELLRRLSPDVPDTSEPKDRKPRKKLPPEAILRADDQGTFSGGPLEKEFGPKNESGGQFESNRKRH